MTFTMIAGFAAIAGLIAGYGTARIGPRWIRRALWPVTALGVLAVYAVLTLPTPANGEGAIGAGFGSDLSRIALFVAMVAFAVAVVCAGVLGGLMASVFERKADI